MIGPAAGDSTVLVRCAGGIVFDDQGRLLLIRRGHAPFAGSWTIPGGRCEPGEAPRAACVRELAEETGLEVTVLRHVGRVERDSGAGVRYEIDDFRCQPLGDTVGLVAGDDASDVRWVDLAEFSRLTLAPLLEQTLCTWGCLPRC